MIITKSYAVHLKGLTPGLVWILYALEEFHRLYYLSQPDNLIITSINDGVHSENSRHYKNEAIDIRSHNFPTRASKRVFRKDLEKYLNNHFLLRAYNPYRNHKFRVLFENVGTPNEHFHVQVRKGTSYP